MNFLMHLFEIENIAFEILGYPISYVELIGTMFGLISVYFATRANILTWSTGIVNEVFLFILFFQVQLYADMLLQVYFFVVTLYGWYQWNTKTSGNRISETNFRNKIFLAVTILIGTMLSCYFFTNIHLFFPTYFKIKAAYPLTDSFVMVTSIVATILLAKKRIENWYLWIAVDLVCMVLYFKKGVYFLSLEYLIFLGLASYGLYHWKKNCVTIKAFVFGKFLPFHKGHEAMINFALSKCDHLTVLVCSSDNENISDTTRKRWIEKAFEKQKNVEIRTFSYLESELPNTSESSKEVSEVWAEIFKKQFPDYSLVITSEEYGNFVAAFMNIQHIAFDISKKHFPVSATAVRNDVFANWKFLPDSVKPDFAIKVVILGTESTGKTTLAENLSTHFGCSLVLEAGREIIANSNSFSFDDLLLVAKVHANRIEQAILGNSPLVIIDTDIHTTKSYSRFTFEKELEIGKDIYNSNKANLYLYLTNDAEYLQDGTRLSEAERNKLDHSHRQVLIDHNIEIIEISGNWNERFEKAIGQINQLIATNEKKHKT